MNRIESLKKFIYDQPSMFLNADATYNAIERLERLAEIGKATELAFKDCIFVIERSYEPAFNNVDDLIGYYRKEVE